MDPWLQGSATQAPTNWWNKGGAGNQWGTGASQGLTGWGGNAQQGQWAGAGAASPGGALGSHGGGSQWGSQWSQGGQGQSVATGGSWGSTGGDWQQWGQGSLTSSSNNQPKPPPPPQRNPNGGQLQWADVNNGAGWNAQRDSWGGTPMEGPNPNGKPVWHWSAGEITSPKPTQSAQSGSGSQWSVTALMELIQRLGGNMGFGGGGAAV